MNTNEKIKKYYEFELKDVEKTINMIYSGKTKLFKTHEVIDNAVNRCYGAFFFAQYFDDCDYTTLAADYEETKEKLERMAKMK